VEIEWSTEWLTSLLWVGKVFAAVLAGFVAVGWLLIRRTRWGRQFWRLAGGFFVPKERTFLSWRPLLTVALLLLLTVIGVRIDVVLSYWNNGLFTALQELDEAGFWSSMLIFGVLASIYIVYALLNFYIVQAQVIHWRQWLNQHMVDDWLKGAAYHRGRFVRAPVDNPDQRIQQDVTSFANISQDLALGVVSAMVTLVSFTIILWQLSGPLTLAGITIPRGLVFLTFIYMIVATVIAFRIGRPLIRLNFLQEAFGASYRYALVRVRENSENVAFYRGEGVENAGLLARFTFVIGNAWDLVYRNLKFQGFNFVVSQISVVLPYILQARRFFSEQITLGDFTQSASAFSSVAGALSFFRNSYDTFASYKAVLDRLTGLLDADDEARTLPSPTIEETESGLQIRDLDVRLPDGRPLLTDLDIELAAGDSLLIKGPSGTGKTTLLRSLAGIWPHGEGAISRPGPDRTLFLSQQAYLPLGSLRTALAYPQPAETLSDDDLREKLAAVQLGHLVGRLDELADWPRTLSPGEQQRLGFGRILLAEPSLLFLDEATSALDEGMEHAMYDLVRERLPECTIVSVGHRSTLESLHSNELTLLGEGRWEANVLAR